MNPNLLSIVGVLILWNAAFTEIPLAQHKRHGAVVRKTAPVNSDTTQWEYFDPDPVTTFRPEIIVPDSLSNVTKPVRVWVAVNVNSLGIPQSYQIKKSGDKRFNKIAGEYSLQYRFQADSVMFSNKSKYIMIPIVFKK
jgi:hypothetical protein